MMNTDLINNQIIFDKEEIENMIYNVRGVYVILSSDVAKLYQVETRRINEVIKRNINRFPDTFCFQLTKEEYLNLRSQFAMSSLNDNNYGGIRYMPYVLTEQGIMMLSGLLKSDIAVSVNIKIIDAFVKMRKYISNNLLYNSMVINHDARKTIILFSLMAKYMMHIHC